MKRLLLLGMCPLPTENESQTMGPGKRTWQFTKPLLDRGHRVCLITARHPAAYQGKGLAPIMAREDGDLVHYSVEPEVFENAAWLQKIHDQFVPDAIVGATVFPSAVAARIRTDRPLWADLFGHSMAEAQSKCLVFEDDYYLFHFWNYERAVLDRADVFSVVSTPQEYATAGELGTRGRLNRRTAGYPLVRLLPCAVDVQEVRPLRTQSRRLRGSLFAEEDFVILWSGGYNTWTDVDTLFAALEQAMAGEPRIRFLSTGGQIDGHDEITYPRFLSMIERSPFRERFLMRGWLPLEEVPLYWAEADVAINIDRPVYESTLGSRNRLLDWMAMGLPIITSRLCELSQIIHDERLGLTFSAGDAAGLAETIRRAARADSQLAEMAERARIYALANFSYEATTRPLLEWAQSPERAPDQGRRVPLELAGGFLSAGRWARHAHALRDRMRATGATGTARWLLGRGPMADARARRRGR